MDVCVDFLFRRSSARCTRDRRSPVGPLLSSQNGDNRHRPRCQLIADSCHTGSTSHQRAKSSGSGDTWRCQPTEFTNRLVHQPVLRRPMATSAGDPGPSAQRLSKSSEYLHQLNSICLRCFRCTLAVIFSCWSANVRFKKNGKNALKCPTTSVVRNRRHRATSSPGPVPLIRP